MNNSKTVSNAYIDLLKDKKVLSALFTSYTIDISFFEAEVLHILTTHNMGNFSPDIEMRRRQLSIYLQKNKIPITLFFDKKINQFNSKDQSIIDIPLSEYLLIPIDSGNNAFHPKVSIILNEDRSSGIRSLLYVNGSNNLSYNGWWENVEGINILSINERDAVSLHLKDMLSEIVKYLDSKLKELIPDENRFVAIVDFIENLQTKNEQKEFYYNSLNLNKKPINFPSFVQKYLDKSDYNSFEIVSPYFAEESSNVIRFIKYLSSQMKTYVYLPLNREREILTTEEIVSNINKEQHIFWADFNKEEKERLSISAKIKTNNEEVESFRTVHAKIFHWYNSQSNKGAYFIGSVNLSHKAFYGNEEVGKLFFVENDRPLLEALDINSIPEVFSEKINDPVIKELVDDYFKDINLIYDWREKKLRVSSQNIEHFFVCLSDKNYLLSEEQRAIAELEKSLVNSPFLTLEYAKKSIRKRGTVFVNQINFECKPLDFGNLKSKHILDLYSNIAKLDGINNKYVEKAIADSLHHQGMVSDSIITLENQIEKNYFSEYSEIFYGLRSLKTYILENEDRKEYFLNPKSEMPDSVPKLIQNILSEDDIEVETKYITLLYIKQIYKDLKMDQTFIIYCLDRLKKNNKSVFDENQKFINWYEKAFFLNFSLVSSDD